MTETTIEKHASNTSNATERTTLLDAIVQQQAAVASRYKPVMCIDELLERDKAITYLVDKVMQEGIDYGWIPGTKPREDAKPGEYQAKPTLFKAGAERACAFFGYAPHFTLESTIQEWTPDKYGELLFHFEYRCALSKDGAAVGEGLGSASTWETKYRYRKGERECPECSKAGAIIKGKAEFGGGWLCFAKKGGCGAKFEDGDEAIEGQATERVPNPDVADVVNTVSKMAQKRAYVAACLTATGLSGRFTQDVEDVPPAALGINTGGHPVGTQAASDYVRDQKIAAGRAAQSKTAQTAPAGDPEITALWRQMGTSIKGVCDAFQASKESCEGFDGNEEAYYRVLSKYGVTHANELLKKSGGLENARAAIAELFMYLKKRAADEAAIAQTGGQ